MRASKAETIASAPANGPKVQDLGRPLYPPLMPDLPGMTQAAFWEPIWRAKPHLRPRGLEVPPPAALETRTVRGRRHTLRE